MSNVLDFQVNGQAPSTVGGTGTSIKYFQRILGTTGPGASVGASPNTNISATNAAGALFVPAFNVYNGQLMEVLAAGSFGSDTGDPSGTVNFQIQAVTGTAAAPVYTTIASSGAVAPTFASAEPWCIVLNLQGDGNSGILQGAYEVYIGGALTKGRTVVDNVITGLNYASGNAALQRGAVFGLVVGVTFGTSNATNTASLFEFAVES